MRIHWTYPRLSHQCSGSGFKLNLCHFLYTGDHSHKSIKCTPVIEGRTKQIFSFISSSCLSSLFQIALNVSNPVETLLFFNFLWSFDFPCFFFFAPVSHLIENVSLPGTIVLENPRKKILLKFCCKLLCRFRFDWICYLVGESLFNIFV